MAMYKPLWVRVDEGEFGKPLSFDKIEVGKKVMLLQPGQPQYVVEVVSKNDAKKEFVAKKKDGKTATMNSRFFAIYAVPDDMELTGGRRKRKTRKMKRRSIKQKK
jgi:hypothetical protein